MKARPRRIEPTIGDLDSIVLCGGTRRPGFLRPGPRCPRGLRIIAWLTILGGLTGMLALLVAYRPLAAGFASVGVPPRLAFAQWAVLFVLAAAGGHLALGASKTGWALLIIVLALEVLVSAQALIAAYGLGVDVSITSAGSLSPYVKHGARLILGISFVAYMLRRAVREFFGLESLTAWAFVGGIAALAMGTALLVPTAPLV
jgi:hypothetical protein